MKVVVKISLLTLLSVSLAGCDYVRHRQAEGVVAELNGHSLTVADLDAITQGLPSADSARVADQYIRQWAVNLLQYDKASSYRDEQIEAMVDDYRRSLYMHLYQQKLITRHMSQDVSDSVIADFYNTHQEQFRLQEGILKGILLVLPQKSPKLEHLKKLLANPTDKNLEKIEKYAYQYSSGYELFTDRWMNFNQILLRLPLEQDMLQQELRRTSLIEVHDSTMLYLVQVTDKHFRGDYMPLDYAADDIRKIVLTERQVHFLQQQRDDLYEDAIKYRKLKLYRANHDKED